MCLTQLWTADREHEMDASPSNPTDLPDSVHASEERLLSGQSAWRTRLAPAFFFALSTGILVLAAWFNPDDKGHGTHTQLGLPDCSFKLSTGMPCPTCGCTTSFALAADGRVIDAFSNQPFGAALAVFTAVISLISGYAMMTGLSLVPLGRFLGRTRVAILLVVVLLGAWVFKILTMTGANP